MHDKAQQALTTTPEVMARVVCTALLAGPLTYDEGARVLERVGLAQPVQQALDDHTVCYPPSLDSAVLEPLYPDRLAEDFLALQSPGSGVDGWPADPWTAKAACHFVTPDVENTMVLFPVGSMRAIIILVDTAHRWPHVGESQLFPLLREHPWLARLAGNRALLGLAELPGIDIATLQAIEAIVPLSQHDAWADLGIAAVAQRLAELRLAAATAPEDVADVYTKVFQPLHHAGLRAEALAANAKALEIYERLANESASFLPHLAGTLNNRAMLLHSSGNTDEALQLAEAAVATTSDLAGRGMAGYEHPTALGTLSAVLSAVGPVGDAIEAAAAATQAWQEMTSRHATPGLALARFGHASLLLRAKRHEEALVAADDAIARLRELTYGDPTAYAPDLRVPLRCGLKHWQSRDEPRKQLPRLLRAPSSISSWRIPMSAGSVWRRSSRIFL
jgi:tetratricopeptide (TPR) repeat protein